MWPSIIEFASLSTTVVGSSSLERRTAASGGPGIPGCRAATNSGVPGFNFEASDGSSETLIRSVRPDGADEPPAAEVTHTGTHPTRHRRRTSAFGRRRLDAETGELFDDDPANLWWRILLEQLLEVRLGSLACRRPAWP